MKSNPKTLWVQKRSGQGLKKGRYIYEKELKSTMDGQGRCSVSADENKILTITIQAVKH